MEPVRAVFDGLKLSDLDRSWVEKAVDSSFTEIDNVPPDYLMFLESSDMAELLNETCVVIKEWMTNNRPELEEASSSDSLSTTEVSWQTLLEFDVDVQGLLAVLAYLMKGGQKFNADQCSRLSCMRATSLYFALLTIPGSNAFRAFHPSLYQIALNTLALTRRLLPATTAAIETTTEEQQQSAVTNSAEERDPHALPKSQSATLIRGLNGVMYDLLIMIKSGCTNLEMGSLELTIRHLVETTKMADETVNEFRAINDQGTFTSSRNSLSYNAYVALCRLCNPKYAPINVITRLIAKHELGHLLIDGGGGGTQLSTKQMTIVRESTIHFFKTLLEEHGKAAHSAVRILIQHLMIKCPDRHEGRQKQAVVIVKLINLTRDRSENAFRFGESMRDLARLSHHNKISARIFAQEIIGKFLLDLARVTNYSSNCTSGDSQNEEESSNETKKILLASALSRCADSSSLVRGRALATLAEYTERIDDKVVGEIFRSGADRAADETIEEMPSLEDLEEVMENRRKLDSVLPGAQALMKMLRARAEDERALVRRSAIETIRNGVLVSVQLLNEAIDIIVERCRDAALTVRRFAIRALTGLLEQFHDNSFLLKHWVESVVPRVFDSEIKVRDQVLESLWKLTIGSIVSYRNGQDGTATAERLLPWKLIREIALSRMTEHLYKACENWVQSGTITDATIAIIGSHVGTENNTGAWLLLASMPETIQLTGMEKYYDYYEKSLRHDENAAAADVFLSCLVIQVLRHCWPSFGTPVLRQLQHHILENVGQFRVDVALISHCLDILDGITVRLETLDEIAGTNTNSHAAVVMRDLVELSESTIAREMTMERRDVGENRRRLDDPGRLIFRATCTLGHASLLCTERISLPTLRTLEGFLVEWRSLPDRVKSRKELQAVAVTVLGQQALRDREIAQEVTPILGQLLRNTIADDDDDYMANGPAVRINAAKALADICIRFTALVEPYLPDMCVSMKDPNSEVRQVILVIFIQLLVEDFIMINGPFFFHIMTMLSDVDSTIRRMAIFLINERLLTKNKKLVSQQFINAIFHYNDCERRNARLNRQRRMRERERRALTLPGDGNRAKRRVIYDFMLQHLDSPGKLAVLVALTNQILNFRGSRRGRGGELDLNTKEAICVVRDALYVASSESLTSNSSNGPAIDEDNDETTTATANSTGTDAIKAHRLRFLLPNIVELKRYVARIKSPLVVDVTKFLVRMIADCTKEQLATGIYSEYPRLEQQIERDIRKYGRAAASHSPEQVEEEEPGGMYGIEAPGGSSLSSREITETTYVTTPRKSGTLDRVSNLIDPNRTPRIVLRRLSSLTYPGIAAGWPSPEFTERIEKQQPSQGMKRSLSPYLRNSMDSHDQTPTPKSPRHSRHSRRMSVGDSLN